MITMMLWIVLPPLIAAVTAVIMARVCYRWGYVCGDADARARHSLASIERERAKRARVAGACP